MKQYNTIWQKAQARNEAEGERFFQIYESMDGIDDPRKKYMVFGIYDSLTHKYATFDTIELVANFRRKGRSHIAEIKEMRDIVSARSKWA